jgi:hypothetical protein
MTAASSILLGMNWSESRFRRTSPGSKFRFRIGRPRNLLAGAVRLRELVESCIRSQEAGLAPSSVMMSRTTSVKGVDDDG